jgi:hypothetical protein
MKSSQFSDEGVIEHKNKHENRCQQNLFIVIFCVFFGSTLNHDCWKDFFMLSLSLGQFCNIGTTYHFPSGRNLNKYFRPQKNQSLSFSSKTKKTQPQQKSDKNIPSLS